MPSTHPSPKEFHLFPHLAPEIRLKIWQHACTPRILAIRYNPDLDRCLCPSRPPSLLQTNRESRLEALRIYTLSFGTQTHPARIYFDPLADTLYLPRHRAMGYDETLRDFREVVRGEERKVLDEVRRVAIDHVDVAVKRPWEAYNKAVLMRGFPKLEQVVVVLGSQGDDNAGKGDRGRNDGMEEEFVEPKRDPEELLRMWVEFRQSIAIEEKVLEDICGVMGREYVKWSLPCVKLKMRRRVGYLH